MDATNIGHILEWGSVPLLQIKILRSPMTQTIENGIFGTGDSSSHIPYLEPRVVYSRTAEFGRVLLHNDIRYATRSVYMIFSSIYMGSIPFYYYYTTV